jgi:hypothetical protein
MLVKVLDVAGPPTGTLVLVESQGGSGIPEVGFNLDGPAPYDAMIVENGDLTKRKYLSEHQLTLSRDERMTFSAHVRASHCSCSFVFELQFNDGSTIEVKPDGEQSFNITTFSRQYSRSYFADLLESGQIATSSCSWPDDCWAR